MTCLICWWVGRHHSLAKGRHLLALQQHLLELGVPTRYEAHVGVNLEAELFPAPQLLGKVAGLTRSRGFLPGYSDLPHLHQKLLACQVAKYYNSNNNDQNVFQPGLGA